MTDAEEKEKGKWDQDYRLSYFEEKISKSKERNSKFRKQGSKGIAR